MIKITARAFALVLVAAVLCSPGTATGKSTFFQENFCSLANWRTLSLPDRVRDRERHTDMKFQVEESLSGYVLKAEARASRGVLISKFKYDVSKFPRLRWQWKIRNVCQGGDNRDRLLDDSPVRISVLFEYDPQNAGILERIKYELAKRKLGEYPPRYILNYIWAARDEDAGCVFDSPQTPRSGRSKVIALQAGEKKAGNWVREDINVARDFRLAFGKEPPRLAALAITSNSDKTREVSVSWLAAIEVYGTN